MQPLSMPDIIQRWTSLLARPQCSFMGHFSLKKQNKTRYLNLLSGRDRELGDATTWRGLKRFCFATRWSSTTLPLSSERVLQWTFPTKVDRSHYSWGWSVVEMTHRSPDTTRCDSFLWGLIKDIVFVLSIPRNLVERIERIMWAFAVVKEPADSSIGRSGISTRYP